VKYRHSFHAGNFADVHKHVALLALLRALQKKDKGFFYLDTHGGRGRYDLSTPSREAIAGIVRFLQQDAQAAELRDFAALIGTLRSAASQRHSYPGSPLIAAHALRPQDRGLIIELQGAEAHELEAALADVGANVRIERGDGFERLRAHLPPKERRGLTLIDPPYEEAQELARVSGALTEGLQRFPTGVFVGWYPIKEERVSERWLAGLQARLAVPLLVSELWLYPRDSSVALNGSGLVIANPPWLTQERMQEWLPELAGRLAVSDSAGSRVQLLSRVRI
jgi:23S rRNA (adenine2030-N6)-methyltransferase